MIRKLIFAWLRRRGMIAVLAQPFYNAETEIGSLVNMTAKSGHLCELCTRTGAQPKVVRKLDRMVGALQGYMRDATVA